MTPPSDQEDSGPAPPEESDVPDSAQDGSDPAGPAGRNIPAVITLVTGLLGLVPIAVGCAVAALLQLKRRGGRGRGLVFGGLAAAAVWTVIAVMVIAVVPFGSSGEAAARKDLPVRPEPGECYDMPGERTTGPRKASCTGPHDAQLITAFPLPAGARPGTETERIAQEGCARRLRALFGTLSPVENSTLDVIRPPRGTLDPGDRRVRCGIIAHRGVKLTAPLELRDTGVRLWSELEPRQCIDFPRKEATHTARLVNCARPHTGQVTDTFTLAAGAWPGDKAVTGKSDAGCTERWERRFGDLAGVSYDLWFRAPNKDSWAAGDYTVQCYLTAPKGELRRSVLTG